MSSSSKTPRDTGTFEYPYSGSIPQPLIHDNTRQDLTTQDYIDELGDPSFFQGDFQTTSSSSSSSESWSSHSISSYSLSHSSYSSCSSSRSSYSSSYSSYSSSSSSESSYECPPMWVTDARVVPSQFHSGETICAEYTYHNAIGEPESGSLIRWYRNNIHQSEHDSHRCIVASGRRGDVWYFTVTPSNGFCYGTTGTSTTGVIVNNPPTPPTRVEIVPHNPQVDDDLFVVASGATDLDGDVVTYRVKWYRTRSGVTEELIAYRNRKMIPYIEVEEGDIFSVEVKAFDGMDESD